MAKKRNWKGYRGKFWRELKEVNNGITLVGTGAAALIGGAAATPVVGLVVGGVLVGGATAIAAWRAIPSRLEDAADQHGQEYRGISGIPEFSEEVPKIAIVGESSAGKSTLIDLLKGGGGNVLPTKDIGVTLLTTRGPSPRPYLLLDGQGESPTQQSAICQEADAIFYFLDHNDSDTEIAVKASRKKTHDELLAIVLVSLSMNRGQFSAIHLLLNKSDLWKSSQSAQDFQKWGADKLDKISAAAQPQKAQVRAHSNKDAADINLVWKEVEDIQS